MAVKNPRQIVKYQTQDKVLELNDKLAMASVESAANLHARHSKIQVVIVDTSKGKGQNAVVTTANVDPIKIKRLYETIMKIEHDADRPTTIMNSNENRIGIGEFRNMTPSEALKTNGDVAVKKLEELVSIFQANIDKYPGNAKKIEEIKRAIEAYKAGALQEDVVDSPVIKTIFYERKINPNENRKNENGEYPVTTLQIDYNPRMNNCWTVYMENGWGKIDTRPNGGIFIKKGSYRPEKETRVVVNDVSFKEMFRQANDYILLKELLFMSKLEKQLQEYEEKQRAAWER